jgi:hypothetical protein
VASNVLPALDASAKLVMPPRGMRRSGGKKALKVLTEGIQGLIGYFLNSIDPELTKAGSKSRAAARP